ncbi:MAG: hypothetical protein D6698_11965, partial [Gammaproteobacteria bacterium]
MGELSGNQVIQNAATGQGGAVAQGESATTVGERDVSVGGPVNGPVSTGNNQSSQPCYFHLCVLEPANDEPVDQLEPDKQYQVIIWIDTSPNSNQSAIPTQTSISLLLKVQEPDKAQYIIIPNPQTSLLAEQTQNFEYQFDLITDARLPHGRVTLSLQYWPENKRYRKKTAVTQQLELVGIFPDDETFLKARVVNLAEKPREKTALLYISETEGAHHVTIKGFGHYKEYCFQVPDFEVQEGIRLADFINGPNQQLPDLVIGRIEHFFTYTNKKL